MYKNKGLSFFNFASAENKGVTRILLVSAENKWVTGKAGDMVSGSKHVVRSSWRAVVKYVRKHVVSAENKGLSFLGSVSAENKGLSFSLLVNAENKELMGVDGRE